MLGSNNLLVSHFLTQGPQQRIDTEITMGPILPRSPWQDGMREARTFLHPLTQKERAHAACGIRGLHRKKSSSLPNVRTERRPPPPLPKIEE